MRRSMKIISIVLIVGLVLAAAFILFIRPWYLTWGATDAEVTGTLPGDEYITNPAGGHTRAITIQATPDKIWPWLVQIGADKGGLYSYTWIEGLINCPITNAEEINPAWQGLQPGDLMHMCVSDPAPPPYEVVAVQPNRALVLGHRPAPADNLDAEWFDTWSFILEPVDAGATRLIARSRNAKNVAWMRIIEPGFFIMESEMLRGIKERAERD